MAISESQLTIRLPRALEAELRSQADAQGVKVAWLARLYIRRGLLMDGAGSPKDRRG